MHRLGTSVLMLIVLPLAFYCKRDHRNNVHQITEDYRHIIEKHLKHVEARIKQLNPNCTIRNVWKWKDPRNGQVIHRRICRVNGQLRRFEIESDHVYRQLKQDLDKLVEEINGSLGCRCHQKKEVLTRQIRKWKPCKVKDILANLQTHFEQYNTYHSLNKESSEQGKTSEQTDL